MTLINIPHSWISWISEYQPLSQKLYKNIMNQSIVLWFLFLATTSTKCQFLTANGEQQVQYFITSYNKQAERYQRMQYQALWAFYKNMTPKSQHKLARLEALAAEFSINATVIAGGFSLESLDPQTVRQMNFIRKNSAPKSKQLVKKLSRAVSSMTHIFGHGKVGFLSFFFSNHSYFLLDRKAIKKKGLIDENVRGLINGRW